MAALLATEYFLGLWHGAGWNYGFFGIYRAVMIGAYYLTRHYWDKMNLFFGGVNAVSKHAAVGDPRRDGIGGVF